MNKKIGIEELLKKDIISMIPISSDEDKKALLKCLDKLQLISETKKSILWISKPNFEEIYYMSPAYEKNLGKKQKKPI